MSESNIREDSFSVTTRIEASPGALYKAWTEKADMENWLATAVEVDARVKGEYILKLPSRRRVLSAW